jgi:hypothetical protein
MLPPCLRANSSCGRGGLLPPAGLLPGSWRTGRKVRPAARQARHATSRARRCICKWMFCLQQHSGPPQAQWTMAGTVDHPRHNGPWQTQWTTPGTVDHPRPAPASHCPAAWPMSRLDTPRAGRRSPGPPRVISPWRRGLVTAQPFPSTEGSRVDGVAAGQQKPIMDDKVERGRPGAGLAGAVTLTI